MFINNNLPSGTVTFLFTDIQGSTPLWEQVPSAMQVAIAQHHHILRQAIESNGGTVYQIIGDAFQAAFRLASQALNAALDAQRALMAANWPESTGPLSVRMGIHTGTAEIDPNDDAPYEVSHTLNRAARIMAIGHGGQILLSQETAYLATRELPDQVHYKDLGEHQLKGMSHKEHIYQLVAPDLPQSFPTLTTSAAPPHNLPAQLTSFVGRMQEMKEVCDLIDQHRLVTLVGPGGTGKTRLLLRVAEEKLDQFHQGVWFAELAGLSDPELVPRTILSVFGLREIHNRPLLEQLQDYLHERKLLLLLDNCEHMITECVALSETLLRSCPKLKILASSREAFGVSGETAYHVPSLSVPDLRHLPAVEDISCYTAVHLFVERAASVKPGFTITETNAQAISQICHRLDGIPLAIELAAARVAVMDVEQIAARLDNRFRLLTGGSRTALPRQQTLRASIDWSYSLLTEQERLLLLRLSVFYGGWTLGLAKEVCGFDGLDEFDLIDGLAQLANKSLILVESKSDASTRYRMLETIRQYANEKLLDSDQSEVVRDRHLAAFVRLAWKAEPHLRSHQQVEWLDRLETEIDNIRSALAWGMEGEVLDGLRLATSIYWFWHIRGYRVEGEQWLQRLQEWVDRKSLAEEDVLLVAEARLRQSMLLAASGNVSLYTNRIAEEAMSMAEGLGEAGRHLQLVALHALRWIKDVQGQDYQARIYAEKGLALAEELDDRFMLAEFLRSMVNHPDRARAKLAAEKSMVLRREMGDLDGLMWTNMGLAQHYFDSGDVIQARLLSEESYRLARKVKNLWGIVAAQCNLGIMLTKSGDLDQGIELFEEVLPITKDLGEPHWTVWVITALGHAADLKQDWRACQAYYEQAIQLSNTHDLAYAEVSNRINLAEAARNNGNPLLARQYYRSAADLTQHPQSRFLQGAVAFALGWVSYLNQEHKLAKNYFGQAVIEFANYGDIHETAHTLDVLSVLLNDQPELAARLHGAADHLRPRYTNWGTMLYPTPINLNVQLGSLRAALGEAEYDRLYKEGKSLAIEQVAAFVNEGT
jgi:predicted ATPase/class 3 adenylate cyclase